MFWRERIIRFQATTSDARLFTTWQPCIGEWNSNTPQRLPKVAPPTTWIDTSLLWFDLIACPRIILCRILNSTWPKLVWNCPCLHMLRAELESSPLQTLLSSNTERSPTQIPRAPWIIRHFDELEEIAILQVNQIVGYCEWFGNRDADPTSAVFDGYVSAQTWTNDFEPSSHIQSRF